MLSAWISDSVTPFAKASHQAVIGRGVSCSYSFNVEGFHATYDCEIASETTKLSLTGLCCAAGRNWTRFLNLARSGSVSFQEQLEQSGSPMHQNPGKPSLIVPYKAVH